MTLTVTRSFNFSYSHRLPDKPGRMGQLHGHNAVLEVAISGSRQEAGPGRGVVIGHEAFGKLVWEEVLSIVDHQDINKLLGEGVNERARMVAALEKSEVIGIGNVYLDPGRILGYDGEVVQSFDEVVGLSDTTAEVFAEWIWHRLWRRIRQIRISSGIHETDLALFAVRLSVVPGYWVVKS